MNIERILAAITTPYPRRDWIAVVVVAGIVLVLSVGVAGYFFFGIQTGALLEAAVPPKNPPPPVSRVDLKTAIDLYTTRLTNFEGKNIPAEDLFDPHAVVQKKK